MTDVFQRLEDEVNAFRVLREEAENAAREEGFTEREEIDSFRHVYASAILAKKYGVPAVRTAGILGEVGGVIRNTINIATGENADSGASVVEDSTKDILNNEHGFEIFKSYNSEKEIRDAVSQGIRDKTIVVEPTVAGDFLLEMENKFDEMVEEYIDGQVIEKLEEKMEELEEKIDEVFDEEDERIQNEKFEPETITVTVP